MTLTASAPVATVAGATAFLNTPNAGSGNVTCDCPPGYVAVGYTGRTGSWVDQSQLACKQLNPDGTLGAAVVYTSLNGNSGGGGANGPYILPGNTVLVGATVFGSNSGNVSGLAGFGQSVAYIAGNGNNTTGATAAGTMGGALDYTVGSAYVPNGMVITGMVGWNTFYTTGFSFRYTPISQFLATYSWSNGATTQATTVNTSASLPSPSPIHRVARLLPLLQPSR